jgi:hypothetical protein
VDAGVAGILIQCMIRVLYETARRIINRIFHGPPPALTTNTESRHNQAKDANCNVIFPNRPAWDIPNLDRFGDHALTPELLWKSMDGLNEPMTNPWWVFLMFLSISMTTPWAAPLEPILVDISDNDYEFISVPAVVGGIPWWAFKSLMLCLVPTVLLLNAIYQMPDEMHMAEDVDNDIAALIPEEVEQQTSESESPLPESFQVGAKAQCH